MSQGAIGEQPGKEVSQALKVKQSERDKGNVNKNTQCMDAMNEVGDSNETVNPEQKPVRKQPTYFGGYFKESLDATNQYQTTRKVSAQMNSRMGYGAAPPRSAAVVRGGPSASGPVKSRPEKPISGGPVVKAPKEKVLREKAPNEKVLRGKAPAPSRPIGRKPIGEKPAPPKKGTPPTRPPSTRPPTAPRPPTVPRPPTGPRPPPAAPRPPTAPVVQAPVRAPAPVKAPAPPPAPVVGKGKKTNARADIVRKVMNEQGMSMIEASKFVKTNGLY
jgi:hypothetical protein